MDVLVGREWRAAGRVADRTDGSLSDTDADGVRHIYRFSCRGRTSVIERAGRGFDVDDPGRLVVDGSGTVMSTRVVVTSGFQSMALLTDGGSFEMDVKADNWAERRKVRFTHHDVDAVDPVDGAMARVREEMR